MPEANNNSAGDSIVAEHLVKKFGDLIAVNDISFSVGHQELFGLLGPNGAGKTTLIRMLTTLTPPTSGTAKIAGHDIVSDADGVRLVIGVIPQALTSDPELTADENMLLHAKLFGVPSNERRELIARLLDQVDLSKFAKTFVRNFSGGMRRRLEIARGLVHSPKILFLDEPTTGLDPVSRTNVWEMIRRLREHSKLTIVLTTHYMDEADKLCDRIAIVDHGKLMALDSPMKLKAAIPGENTLEVSFTGEPADWKARLGALPGVVRLEGDPPVYRLVSTSGPQTTNALMAAAAAAGVTIGSLSVQSTSLDDVFVHYTGHQLRDALQEPSVTDSRFMMRR